MQLDRYKWVFPPIHTVLIFYMRLSLFYCIRKSHKCLLDSIKIKALAILLFY